MDSIRSLLRRAPLLILLGTSAPAAAKMTDVWDQKYEGVRHLVRTGTDDAGVYQSYHVALVDLTNPNVHVRTVLNQDTWGGAKEVVSKMAQRHQAVVAVNGDYWSWGTYDPSQGTCAVEGTCYRAHPERSALALSSDLSQVEIGRFGTWPIPDGPPDDCPPWVHNAVAAGPQFLFAGVARWETKANAQDAAMVDINDDTWFGAEAKSWGSGRNPNTAVGITADKRTLILVTCDGRNAGGAGGCRMSSDMAALMLEFGAHDALKLDSGGSTTFFYDGAVRNNPSGGAQRAVVDALIVQSTPLVCQALLGATPVTIDDGSACFSRDGSAWWVVPRGAGGSSMFTYAADTPTPECSGSWSFDVATPGRFLVEAHVPDEADLSRQARYRVLDAAGAELLAVDLDQEAARGTWAALGEVQLHGKGQVTLGDNTGEPLAEHRKLIFDALRFTAAAAPPAADAGPVGDGPAGPGPIPRDGAAEPAVDADAAGPTTREPSPPVEAEGGCGCAAGGAPGPLSLAVLLVAAALLRRRRERRG